MKQNLSAISLLLLIVVLAASVLGILSLVTSQAEMRLAQRQAEYLQGVQECNNLANRWLQENNAEICSGAYGFELQKVFTDNDGHFLEMVLTVSNGNFNIIKWRNYTQWSDKNVIDNLVQFAE